MSYCLLWIETLLACLLFAAMLITLSLRRKTRTARALCEGVALLPVIPLGLLLMFTAGLQLVSGLRSSGFVCAIILLACYLAGTIAMRRLAGRRDTAGLHRALSWPVGRIATAWLVVVSLLAMTFWNLDLRAQMEIQALRAEAGAIALSVTPPQIPDSANAAWVYDEVDRATLTDKIADYRQSAQIRDYLQRQKKRLATVRRAADMPECRIDYDFSTSDFDLLLFRFTFLRDHANLLALAARTEAADGDPGLALTDCRRIYAIGRHVASLPLFITEWCAIEIDTVASMTVVEVLPAVTTKEQLDHFTIPDPRALSRGFARSLRGEEALGLGRLCDMGSGKGISANGVSPIGGTLVWLMWLHDDINVYREYQQRFREIAQTPYYQTAAWRKQIEEELQPDKRPGVISPVITASLLSIMPPARAGARRATVVVACAATRYRLDHGDYPATADLLLPGYLESMPVDPFDGQPMRLKKMPSGELVIYSVGPDGIDNGGDVDSNNCERTPSDVGIILKMPSPR